MWVGGWQKRRVDSSSQLCSLLALPAYLPALPCSSQHCPCPLPPSRSHAVTTATIHTFENTVVQCREDPGQGLAAAATQREQQAPVAVVRGGSGMPAWEVGVVAAAAASAVVLAALAAAALLLRLRRAAARPARSAADQQPPRAPAGNQVDLLESGDLTEKMGDVDTLQEVVLVLAGASSRDDTQGSVSPATSPNTPAAPGGRWRPSPADLRFPSADVLARKAQLCRRWVRDRRAAAQRAQRCCIAIHPTSRRLPLPCSLSGSSKFGSVREIEIGEVLGRGGAPRGGGGGGGGRLLPPWRITCAALCAMLQPASAAQPPDRRSAP